MIVSSNERDMASEVVEDDDDITSKPQLVLAAKSRRIRYTSSPVICHHVSLSLLSSLDDSRRASVPFSWEEEPGKPKHHRSLLPSPYSSTCIHLPPRLLLPAEFTKKTLASSHRHLAWLKRWFRWKKERSDNEDTKKTTRTRGLDCLSDSDVNKCYFWEVKFHGRRRSCKNMVFERRCIL